MFVVAETLADVIDSRVAYEAEVHENSRYAHRR
jgi:hypothetical protein